MAVDDQIQDLEDRLSNQLQYALFVNINLEFWEELDELDNESVQVIRDVTRDIFAPMHRVYRDTAVEPLLIRCQDLIENALIAAMNVPFPRDPVAHVHRVVRNILELFIRTTYAQLRTEMIMIDHSAQLIQRNWRHVNTNPNHLACRRRLRREFENMVSCTPPLAYMG